MSQPSPSFNHYLIALGDGQPLETVLVGHLVIEALIVEALQASPLDGEQVQLHKINFPQKLELLVSLRALPDERKYPYEQLNHMRNCFAHRLGHSIDHAFMFGLVARMAKLGYDFSDDTIHTDKKLSAEWYGPRGILIEVLNNLYNELATILFNAGGPDRRGG